MPNGHIVGVTRVDTMCLRVRVIAKRLVYDTTLAALIVLFALLFCITVLAAKAWGDAHGMPRLGVATMPLTAKVLFLVAVFVRTHLAWMRK